MTCREKLKLEHPELVGDIWAGNCSGCPHTYGYMHKPEYCTDYGNDRLCSKCWDRELPDVAVQNIAVKRPIKFKIFFGTISLQLNKGMTADEKANEWIAANPDIDILQMQYHQAESGDHSICIMYKE